jgi:hypothetical protein
MFISLELTAGGTTFVKHGLISTLDELAPYLEQAKQFVHRKLSEQSDIEECD